LGEACGKAENVKAASETGQAISRAEGNLCSSVYSGVAATRLYAVFICGCWPVTRISLRTFITGRPGCAGCLLQRFTPVAYLLKPNLLNR
jgi:hypothetical protein